MTWEYNISRQKEIGICVVVFFGVRPFLLALLWFIYIARYGLGYGLGFGFQT